MYLKDSDDRFVYSGCCNGLVKAHTIGDRPVAQCCDCLCEATQLYIVKGPVNERVNVIFKDTN